MGQNDKVRMMPVLTSGYQKLGFVAKLVDQNDSDIAFFKDYNIANTFMESYNKRIDNDSR